MNYYLLDARAGALAAANNGNLHTEDNGKYIVFVGTAKECCKYANDNSFGNDCVVSDTTFKIKWEWFQHAKWKT